MGRAARVDCDIDRGARRGWMGMPRPTLAVVVLMPVMVTRSVVYLARGRRLDSGWEGGGFLGTAARRLAAWPLWLVHLSGSRVVRFSGCSRVVVCRVVLGLFSVCPFLGLSVSRVVRLSICASVLLCFRPSILLSLWCT